MEMPMEWSGAHIKWKPLFKDRYVVRHWLFQLDTTVLGDSNSTTMLDPEEPFL